MKYDTKPERKYFPSLEALDRYAETLMGAKDIKYVTENVYFDEEANCFYVIKREASERLVNALRAFKDAYYTLVDCWYGEDADLMEDANNAINGIDYLFFTQSFDELEIGAWASDMLKNLGK